MGKLRFLNDEGDPEAIAKGAYLVVGAFFTWSRFAFVKAHINCEGDDVEMSGEEFSQLAERHKQNERILSSGNTDGNAVAFFYHIIFFNSQAYSAEYFLDFFHVFSPSVTYTVIEVCLRVGDFLAKIYIDQGHNPQNPNAGAEGNGYREQDLVYEIGLLTAEILRGAGQEVRLSRPFPDTQLGTSNATSLMARVNEANSWGADLFVSLHANASEIPTASGSEAYVFQRGGAAEALAKSILRELSDATGLSDRGVFVRPTLYVLRKTRMPATLVELGFITNPADASLMANEPWLFAAGVANGILSYLGQP